MPYYIKKREENFTFYNYKYTLLIVSLRGLAVVQMFASSKNSKFVPREGRIFQNQDKFTIFPILLRFFYK